MMRGGTLAVAFLAAAMAASAAAMSVPAVVPSGPPCPVCATLLIEQYAETFYSVTFTAQQCAEWNKTVVEDMTSGAKLQGAELLPGPPTVTCAPDKMEVCLTFASDEDGQKMQEYVDFQIGSWYETFVNPCKAYFQGAFHGVTMVSNGVDDTGCVNSIYNIACDPAPVSFPVCKCNTDRASTPFFAMPFITAAPGRTNATTLYCFELTLQEPSYYSEAACSESTTLFKAEIYADDSHRRKVKGLAVQPAGATDLTYSRASWGGTGDRTLKFTSLNWDLEEANGGKLCIELDNSIDLDDLCFGYNTGNCRLSLFDKSKTCCPTYMAAT